MLSPTSHWLVSQLAHAFRGNYDKAISQARLPYTNYEHLQKFKQKFWSVSKASLITWHLSALVILILKGFFMHPKWKKNADQKLLSK